LRIGKKKIDPEFQGSVKREKIGILLSKNADFGMG